MSEEVERERRKEEEEKKRKRQKTIQSRDTHAGYVEGSVTKIVV